MPAAAPGQHCLHQFAYRLALVDVRERLGGDVHPEVVAQRLPARRHLLRSGGGRNDFRVTDHTTPTSAGDLLRVRLPSWRSRPWKDRGMYSLLLYDYVDDIVERRVPFREAHLALVREAHEQGVL